MDFGFQLLGLLVIFLLILVYYSKRDNFTRGNKVFRGMLLVAYLMQVVFFGIYVYWQNGDYGSVYETLYEILSNLFVTLVFIYYGVILLKGELKLRQHKGIFGVYLVSVVLLGLYWIWRVFLCTFCHYSSIDFVLESEFNYQYTPSVLGMFLVFEFVLLIIGKKQVRREKYVSLVILFVIELVTFIMQLEVGGPIFHIGVIILVIYLYFTLENGEREELENLRLERDYALANTFSKSAFLKNLSYEIRTPINTIDGFSQVILESSNMEEIQEDIRDIRVASRELIDIINGMIDLSIIESGNLEIIYENYNVYDLIDSVVQIMDSKMRGSSVAFHTDIEKDIPEVLLGDSERISQVVLNLLLFAFKYTDNGEINFRVDSVKSSSMCRLKFIVQDTGRGMKEEELKQLTLQGDRSKLGLRVAKYLVELMGGNFEVDSIYDKGTTFIVTIDQKIVGEKAAQNGHVHKKIQPMDATGRRILVVDDNKLNLKVASKLLAPYHVEVIEANSGQECLDILNMDTNFDLILMDDMMPNMSGTETLGVVKKLGRIDGYYIPVVVLTANAVSGMKEKYMEAGFDDYLSKPIERQELDRVLRKYIKK